MRVEAADVPSKAQVKAAVPQKSTDNWLCQLDGLLCLGSLSGPELCLVIESEAIDDSCEPFYNLLIADY